MGTNEDNHGNVVETGIWLLQCCTLFFLTKAIGVRDFLP
jgi:hypothetical protein